MKQKWKLATHSHWIIRLRNSRVCECPSVTTTAPRQRPHQDNNRTETTTAPRQQHQKNRSKATAAKQTSLRSQFNGNNKQQTRQRYNHHITVAMVTMSQLYRVASSWCSIQLTCWTFINCAIFLLSYLNYKLQLKHRYLYKMLSVSSHVRTLSNVVHVCSFNRCLYLVVVHALALLVGATVEAGNRRR